MLDGYKSPGEYKSPGGAFLLVQILRLGMLAGTNPKVRHARLGANPEVQTRIHDFEKGQLIQYFEKVGAE